MSLFELASFPRDSIGKQSWLSELSEHRAFQTKSIDGEAEGSTVAQQQCSGNRHRGVEYILFIIIVFMLLSESKNIKVYKRQCGFLVTIFLKILMPRQEKVQDRRPTRIWCHRASTFRVFQVPFFPIFLACPALICRVAHSRYSLNKSAHKKILYFFHEFTSKCYLSKVYLHFILNLISDCGSKEFNTLLRGF